MVLSLDLAIRANFWNKTFSYYDDVKLTYAISCVCFSEKGTLNLWVTLAIEYYRRGKRDEFVRILDVARVDANLGYPNSDEDQVQLFQWGSQFYHWCFTYCNVKGPKTIFPCIIFSNEKFGCSNICKVRCYAYFGCLCLAMHNSKKPSIAAFHVRSLLSICALDK